MFIAERTARAGAPATYYLCVRITAEEASRLEQYRTDRQLATRSDAVRALVREAVESTDRSAIEIPTPLKNTLEELVEDGYAGDLESIATLVLTHGIRELSRTYTEDVSALRERARSSSARRAGRRRADREGRGLLGR